MTTSKRSARMELVGVDVGGTFTDFVWLVDGRMVVRKVATTPDDQSRAVEAGLKALGVAEGAFISHGTTTATNALLEHRGARCALITTAGFRDVLAIGRQNRPHLYRLTQKRPLLLVPDDLRFDVPERISHEGDILTPLDEEAVRRIAVELNARGVESAAVVFLFSFRNPIHERRAGALIRDIAPQIGVSLSCDILPEYREYERTATTVINAYVQPVIAAYFDRLHDVVAPRQIRVMQSNGGTIGVTAASHQAARLVLSGPAGGVVGAYGLARSSQGGAEPRLITFDMGGTSTDVALCDRSISRTSESEIAGLPLRLPSVDIHTVGAGGGSIARVDAAGVLRVGPESAGADPGPACYGRGGTDPTVTDANVVLGRIQPQNFLGGDPSTRLDAAAARAAVTRLGRHLGFNAEEAALGVVRIANAAMERALRRVSVERGHDPRDFTLVPFGGAGPLHACELADVLGIRRIFLPPNPGVLSALGLLVADIVFDTSAAVLESLPSPDIESLRVLVDQKADSARRILKNDGHRDIRVETSVDVRYRGQSYELEVPLDRPVDADALGAAEACFHEAHRKRYGHAMPEEVVEIVTVRARASAPGAARDLPLEGSIDGEQVGRESDGEQASGESGGQASGESGGVQAGGREAVAASAGSGASAASVGRRPVWTASGEPVDAPCYDRSQLRPGQVIEGPALVFQYDTTIYLSPAWRAQVDRRRNLRLQRR